jgi:hypothetical protein
MGKWLYSPSLSPGLVFSFVTFFTKTVGLLERVISPPQGRYLNTGQHKHRINASTHQTYMPRVGFEPTIIGTRAGLGYISPHTHERTPNFARTFQYPE